MYSHIRPKTPVQSETRFRGGKFSVHTIQKSRADDCDHSDKCVTDSVYFTSICVTVFFHSVNNLFL
jgi:hypothetical protein